MTGAVLAAPGALRHDGARRLATVSLAVLAAVAVLTASAPLLALGREPDDLLVRLTQGTREAVASGLAAGLLALSIGALCGLLAGMHSGRVEAVVGWIAYLSAATPALIFLVVVVANANEDLSGVLLVFGVLAVIPFFLLVRSAVRAVRATPSEGRRRRQGQTTVGQAVPPSVPPRRARLIGLSLFVFSIVVVGHFYIDLLGPVDPEGATWGSMLRHSLHHLSTGSLSDWTPLALLVLTAGAATGLGFAVLPVPPLDPAPVVPAESGRDRPTPTSLDPLESDEPMPSIWFRSSALLDVRGLRISVAPDTPDVVSGVSLTVAAGEIVGLLGGADSGALEIALAAGGLLNPGARITGGSILFNGVELVGLPERSATRLRGTDMSYIPREPLASLDGAFSVGAHLQAPLRQALCLSRAASKRLSLELLKTVGFPDPRAAFALFPRDLTPLMAQRVLIAGAISCDPELLVADNPTQALDAADAATVIDLLHRLQDELAFTLMIVTDSVPVLAASCRRVAVVREGTIVEHASVPDLLASPQHDYTRRLVAAARGDALTRISVRS